MRDGDASRPKLAVAAAATTTTTGRTTTHFRVSSSVANDDRR